MVLGADAGSELPRLIGPTRSIRSWQSPDEIRRLETYYRTPTYTMSYGFQLDEILRSVNKRVEIARALTKDELSHLRALADHAIDEWTKVAEKLRFDK